ncbi:unnamed protein product [Lampetra fluviatilis]
MSATSVPRSTHEARDGSEPRLSNPSRPAFTVDGGGSDRRRTQPTSPNNRSNPPSALRAANHRLSAAHDLRGARNRPDSSPTRCGPRRASAVSPPGRPSTGDGTRSRRFSAGARREDGHGQTLPTFPTFPECCYGRRREGRAAAAASQSSATCHPTIPAEPRVDGLRSSAQRERRRHIRRAEMLLAVTRGARLPRGVTAHVWARRCQRHQQRQPASLTKPSSDRSFQLEWAEPSPVPPPSETLSIVMSGQYLTPSGDFLLQDNPPASPRLQQMDRSVRAVCSSVACGLTCDVSLRFD